MMSSSYKERVGSRFSQKADSYDNATIVQKQMAEALVAGLPSSDKTPGAILEIGCGTGYVTSLIHQCYPASSIVAIDIAQGMIEKAVQRLGQHGSDIYFLHADVEQWAADQQVGAYDLIVSSACFQWLLRPADTLRHLRRLLTSSGSLCFTTFGPDTFYELHQSFDEAYASLGLESKHRHGLSFLSAKEWEMLLKDVGFYQIETYTDKCVLHYPSALDFLRAVKLAGANTTTGTSHPGLGERRLLFAMMQHYEQRFSCAEGVAATYDTVRIVARL